MPAWMRSRWRSKKKPSAAAHNHHDGQNPQHHKKTLHAASRPYAHTVYCRERDYHRNRRYFLRDRASGKFAKVFSEGHSDGRCSARINHQYAHPSVEKTEQRVVSLANVSVLPTHFRHAIRKFSVNKSSHQREEPARQPGTQNHSRRVHQLRHHIGVDEYAGTDDPAHHQHGGVKNSQASNQP